MARTVQGKKYQWQMSDAPIGSGDAGEVYDVMCIDQPELKGMMKKPARVATGGTIQRQASQIALESQALALLEGLPTGKAHPPRLLDEAPDFTKGSANYFIVSETAPGRNLEDLLTQVRQDGKPFPRRVIITILDALFDLFSRAHKAGVLWNDVKMDHIYWHNPTAGVSVIDWGNAQFLSGESEKGPRSLPRWEDYRQLVESLGGFLQRNAPEMYADLGWEEFVGEEMDSLRVSVLARRIAYQQQVISLRVMENQALMRIVLSDPPTWEGLLKIHGHQQALEQIGAPYDQPGVLNYCQELIKNALQSGDRQTAVKSFVLIWDQMGEELGVSWYLLREIFTHADILAHQELPALVVSILDEHWAEALWVFIKIARALSYSRWWDKIMPVLRQKALGLSSPPPYKIGQKVMKWVLEKHPGDTILVQKMTAIMKNWRTKGGTLMESPFDYELMELFQHQLDVPGRLRSEFKLSFAPGEDAIGELSAAWTKADWESLPNIIRKTALWDPDRWGVVNLAQQLEKFQTWLNLLSQGPSIGEDISEYFKHMYETRPKLERMLGETFWLEDLTNMLSGIQDGEATSNFIPEIQNWCPWLLRYPSITPGITKVPTQDEQSVHEVLSHFATHLKAWGDIEAGLQKVKREAPAHYAVCQNLADSFEKVFSLTPNDDVFEWRERIDFHPALMESQTALSALHRWRQAVIEGESVNAIKHLEYTDLPGWRVVSSTLKKTRFWEENILPLLRLLSGEDMGGDLSDCQHTQDSPLLAAQAWVESRQTWQSILEKGLQDSLFEPLNQSIESTRSRFLAWRHRLEHSGDRVIRLIYQAHLPLIGKISDQLSRLAQHSRKAKINMEIFNKSTHTLQAVKMQVLESILEHLSAIELILVRDTQAMCCPQWLDILEQLKETSSTEERQQVVLSLPEDYPIYAILVQMVFSNE